MPKDKSSFGHRPPKGKPQGRRPDKKPFGGGKPPGAGRPSRPGKPHAPRDERSSGDVRSRRDGGFLLYGRPKGEGRPQREDRAQRDGRSQREDRPQRDGRPQRQFSVRPQRGVRPQRDGHPKPEGGPRRSGPSQRPVPQGAAVSEPMRIAKAMARAGLCSRREAERWIAEGRVSVNGQVLATPAVEVKPKDRILVDGRPLPVAEPARLWRYNKPKGVVTTHNDPQGRPTVFDSLPPDLPRVISVGRLDFNTEGLILLTNDGELARHLELPATGWLRRYRVRAKGRVNADDLASLKDGVEVEGVRYGPVEVAIDTMQGANTWLTVGIREGKNREVRKVLAHLGLEVNRLIRVSFGPFQLLDLKPGEAESVKRRVLADQLGAEIAEQFRLLDDREEKAQAKKPGFKKVRAVKERTANERGDNDRGRKPHGDKERSERRAPPREGKPRNAGARKGPFQKDGSRKGTFRKDGREKP